MKHLNTIAFLVFGATAIGLHAQSKSATPTTPTTAATSDEVDLFPVVVNGVWGYINREGKQVIPLQYSSARRFHEGLACACVGNKESKEWCGYIDPKGQWVVKPRYGRFDDFSDGLAGVVLFGSSERVQDGLYPEHFIKTYIDKTGKTVITLPADTDASDFHEGYAVRREPTPLGASYVGRYGFIDKTGRWAIKPVFASNGIYDGFSHGLALAQSPHDPKHVGFISASGQFVIPARYEDAFEFSEGLALVRTYSTEPGKKGDIATFGFLNIRGEWAIEPCPGNAHSFSNGLAPFQPKQYGSWGFIDNMGRVVIKPHFFDVQPFSDNRAKVLIGRSDGSVKIAYIDKRGRPITTQDFSEGEPFHNELAHVRVFKQISPPGNAAPVEGQTIVAEDTNGYIDVQGHWVWKTTERKSEIYVEPPRTS